MMQRNRIAEKAEQWPFVRAGLLRSDRPALAGGNRCGREREWTGMG